MGRAGDRCLVRVALRKTLSSDRAGKREWRRHTPSFFASFVKRKKNVVMATSTRPDLASLQAAVEAAQIAVTTQADAVRALKASLKEGKADRVSRRAFRGRGEIDRPPRPRHTPHGDAHARDPG